MHLNAARLHHPHRSASRGIQQTDSLELVFNDGVGRPLS